MRLATQPFRISGIGRCGGIRLPERRRRLDCQTSQGRLPEEMMLVSLEGSWNCQVLSMAKAPVLGVHDALAAHTATPTLN